MLTQEKYNITGKKEKYEEKVNHAIWYLKETEKMDTLPLSIAFDYSKRRIREKAQEYREMAAKGRQ
jgi:hypothetical protein